jgi:hypothetical protein
MICVFVDAVNMTHLSLHIHIRSLEFVFLRALWSHGTFVVYTSKTEKKICADIVLHSGTKYLSGHNDVMCGALAGR